MASAELTNEVLGYVAVSYGVEADTLSVDTTFDSLEGGSMKMIALTSTLENELDSEITVSEVMNMTTLGELVDAVEAEQ